MLVRQEEADGVEVLSVDGLIEDGDCCRLVEAVQSALGLSPRAVLLDLHALSGLAPGARDALAILSALPAGWPRVPLLVCLPGSAEVAPGGVLPGMVVAGDRGSALAQAADRSSRPRARVTVDHGPTGPSQARAAVAECSDRLGLHELRDDVALIVSEMVTNAVRHAAPPVELEIEAGDEEVVVAVRDGSRQRPTARDADENAEGGRGMLLVDLLAAEHGVRSQPPGKTVWARLRHRSNDD